MLAEVRHVAERYASRVDPTKIICRSVWKAGMETADDLLTERGQIHGPSAFGTFYQESANVMFQAVDLGDERRLRDAEMSGGLA